MKWLCLIFGVTPLSCSRILQKIICMTVKHLRYNPLLRVKFLGEEQKRQFADMISAREPMVSNVIGFMSGVSFSSECTDERIHQNAYYCGYDCDTMVNNLIRRSGGSIPPPLFFILAGKSKFKEQRKLPKNRRTTD